MILICDFTGFQAPEIVKKRCVVVLSPRRRCLSLAATTVIVVPFSTTAPIAIEEWHVLIAARPGVADCWAKADLITHVRLARLDRVRHERAWITPMLEPDELSAVRRAVGIALRN